MKLLSVRLVLSSVGGNAPDAESQRQVQEVRKGVKDKPHYTIIKNM